ncbi:YggT family protein [Vallitalea longa]|jgi:YggT family protein|uniref:YggT family protein n=1 Tax=Vallitalea longa TaxID=2936439 RepID=A0A9W5YB99_9FIRM|nr:YggT family protein [Vallitalea longa]GKX28794.1 YggT family protein [Vallitalea longa]
MEIVLSVLYLFLFVLEILLIIRVLLSWIPNSYDNPVAQFIIMVTEPLLSPIRKLIEKSIFGGKGNVLDFSPLIAFLVIRILQNMIGKF